MTTAARWNADEQVQKLEQLRIRIAAMSQALAERELSGRLLRLTIETELQASGKTKTDSDKLAKADARYVDHEKRSVQISYDRDIVLAEAEALKLRLQLTIAERLAEIV